MELGYCHFVGLKSVDVIIYSLKELINRPANSVVQIVFLKN
jgi:hypothetical protein